jgi:hypothetical protein
LDRWQRIIAHRHIHSGGSDVQWCKLQFSARLKARKVITSKGGCSVGWFGCGMVSHLFVYRVTA